MSTSFPPSPAEESVNPYAAPVSEIGSEALGVGPDLSDVEAIRRQYLRHEAAVKGIGSLMLLGGVFFIFGGIYIIAFGAGIVGRNQQQIQGGISAGIGAALLGLGILQFFVGNGLRRLQPWARWTETVLVSVNTLLNLVQLNPFPLLIMIYILYLLLSSKGRMVFSPEYRAVIEQTPHIRYKTSRIVKILLVVLVAIVLLAIIAVLGSSVRVRG